jgi:hypothetical protein
MIRVAIDISTIAAPCFGAPLAGTPARLKAQMVSAKKRNVPPTILYTGILTDSIDNGHFKTPFFILKPQLNGV